MRLTKNERHFLPSLPSLLFFLLPSRPSLLPSPFFLVPTPTPPHLPPTEKEARQNGVGQRVPPLREGQMGACGGLRGRKGGGGARRGGEEEE
eukprot:766529-Hanusia_phi.AAC.7